MAEKKFAVVASDRMVTISIPSTEFEQNVSKTVSVTDSCLVSAAGNALGYSPIHLETLKQIENDSSIPDIMLFCLTKQMCFVPRLPSLQIT